MFFLFFYLDGADRLCGHELGHIAQRLHYAYGRVHRWRLEEDHTLSGHGRRIGLRWYIYIYNDLKKRVTLQQIDAISEACINKQRSNIASGA